VIEAVVDPDVPLLPPFPAGRQKLDMFRQGLDAEGESGRHARAMLDEHARHEEGSAQKSAQ
jgi:pyruvate dehydrogenase (quinone)